MGSTASGVVDCFYIALLSTLQQTYCALVSCDSEINDCSFFTAHFEYPCTQVVCLHRCLVVTSGVFTSLFGVFTSLFGCYKWCIYIAVWLLHGWCHSKLLPSRRVLCTPYNHAPYHVTSCKVTYVRCMRV